MIPSIGVRGLFKIGTPFSSYINVQQEFKVVSIDTIPKIVNAGQDPIKTIYEPVGLSKDDFNTDLDNNVKIITLSTDSGEYIYIPDKYILSQPIVNGINYREKTIMVNLGYLPVNHNIDTLTSIVEDDIYDVLGIKTNAAIIDTSTTISIEGLKHKEFMLKLENKKKIDKSYRTRYLMEVERNKKLEKTIKDLEEELKKHI